MAMSTECPILGPFQSYAYALLKILLTHLYFQAIKHFENLKIFSFWFQGLIYGVYHFLGSMIEPGLAYNGTMFCLSSLSAVLELYNAQDGVISAQVRFL